MSYVIQNFYNLQSHAVFTPRLKFSFLLINLDKFFFFFKQNMFFFLFKNKNIFFINYFCNFTKYFFAKQFVRFFRKVNFNLIGFYDNNLIKSFVHWIYKTSTLFLIKIFQPAYSLTYLSYPQLCYSDNSNILNNLYFLSVKVLNVEISKKYYKNFFFLLMYFNATFWTQPLNLFKFYLNFCFIHLNLVNYSFYNGYFMNVYNF